MKKGIAFAAAAVVIVAAVIIFANPGTFKNSAASSSKQPETSSQAGSGLPSSSGGSNVSSNESESTDENANKIKAAVNVDWSKYRLNKEEKKTIGGTTYLAYTMWKDDYQEGPLLLVNPDTGKVYSWSSSDKTPVPADEDEAFDKTVHTVTVTLTDGAMMSYIGKTEGGSSLTLPRYGVDLVNFDNVKIGDKVKVYYTGVINGEDMSRAFVTKLEKI